MRNTSTQAGTWGEYVEALRKATGLSRPKLAERLGIDPTTVWRWERRGQKPESAAIPQAVASLFALDLDEVLAAAGMRPDVEPPPEPTTEPDPEIDAILAAPVGDRQKKRMLELLFQMRERDRQRRMEDIAFLLDREAGR